MMTAALQERRRSFNLTFASRFLESFHIPTTEATTNGIASLVTILLELARLANPCREAGPVCLWLPISTFAMC